MNYEQELILGASALAMGDAELHKEFLIFDLRFLIGESLKFGVASAECGIGEFLTTDG
jgi:hypothetical protein